MRPVRTRPATLLKTLFVLSALFLATFPPLTSAAIRSVRHLDVRYLLLNDVAHYYGMNASCRGAQCELTSRYSHLLFERNQRAMTLNGVKVHLCYAPSRWQGRPIISQSDFLHVIEPVLRRKSLPRQTVRRIVLDPGHGGRDPGAQASGMAEKDLVLAIAREVDKQLSAAGFTVLLTRNSDQFVSLTSRSAFLARAKADLFVSIHANAVGTHSVHGVETFVLTPHGTPSSYGTSPRDGGRAAGDAHAPQSMRLGYEIQRRLVAETGARDRGVRRANFAVLRATAAPAVLVETGFVTNPQERARLANAAYQLRIARALAQGVARYAQAVGTP